MDAEKLLTNLLDNKFKEQLVSELYDELGYDKPMIDELVHVLSSRLENDVERSLQGITNDVAHCRNS